MTRVHEAVGCEFAVRCSVAGGHRALDARDSVADLLMAVACIHDKTSDVIYRAAGCRLLAVRVLAPPVRAHHTGLRVLDAHFDVQGAIHCHETECWESSACNCRSAAFASDTIDYCSVDGVGGSVVPAP
jgi:hypothetical protein